MAGSSFGGNLIKNQTAAGGYGAYSGSGSGVPATTIAQPVAKAPGFSAGTQTTVPVNRAYTQYAGASAPQSNVYSSNQMYDYSPYINQAMQYANQYNNLTLGGIGSGANGMTVFGTSYPGPHDATTNSYIEDIRGGLQTALEQAVRGAGAAGMTRAGSNVASTTGVNPQSAGYSTMVNELAGMYPGLYDQAMGYSKGLYGANMDLFNTLLGQGKGYFDTGTGLVGQQGQAYQSYLDRLAQEEQQNYQRQQQAQELARTNAISDTQRRQQQSAAYYQLEQQQQQEAIKKQLGQTPWGGYPAGTPYADLYSEYYNPSGPIQKGAGLGAITYK